MDLITKLDDERLEGNYYIDKSEYWKVMTDSLRAALEREKEMYADLRNMNKVNADIGDKYESMSDAALSRAEKADAEVLYWGKRADEAERQLCRAREAIGKFTKAFIIAVGDKSPFSQQALKTLEVDMSSPCPHEAENKQLKDREGLAKEMYESERLRNEYWPDWETNPLKHEWLRIADAALRWMEEAVEWACENAPAGENAYVAGIRRRREREGR